AAEKVNINTADAATLERVLVNVGPSKAEAIVAYRKANGPFRSAEQLAEVKGIGLRTVERNRERIVVGAGAAPARPAAAPTRATAQTGGTGRLPGRRDAPREGQEAPRHGGAPSYGDVSAARSVPGKAWRAALVPRRAAWAARLPRMQPRVR